MAAFEELVGRLRAAHGENLVSVILYGSAVASGASARKGDYRVVVVTRTLTAEELRRVRPAAKWWVSAGYALPVYFTAAELRESLDVFPIEFRQLKRSYRVLDGEDLLAGVEVSPANLRLQTEYELRGKLLRLRGLYLPAGDTSEGLTGLMTESIVSFVQFLRPVLELLGEEPPVGRHATIRRVGERLGLDTAPLERILRLRDDPARLMEAEVQDLFASYLDCLTHVIEAVDNL
jgi:hypothetical protein